MEKEMATHSSVLAWRIPGVGEPGGQASMGSHRVGHDWSDLAVATGNQLRLLPPLQNWLIKFSLNTQSHYNFIQGLGNIFSPTTLFFICNRKMSRWSFFLIILDFPRKGSDFIGYCILGLLDVRHSLQLSAKILWMVQFTTIYNLYNFNFKFLNTSSTVNLHNTPLT